MSDSNDGKRHLVWMVTFSLLAVMLLGPLMLEIWSGRSATLVQKAREAAKKDGASVKDIEQAIRRIQEKEPDAKILSVKQNGGSMDIQTAKIGDIIQGNVYHFGHTDQGWESGSTQHCPIAGISLSDMLLVLDLAAKDSTMANCRRLEVKVTDEGVTVGGDPEGERFDETTFVNTNGGWTSLSGRSGMHMSFSTALIHYSWFHCLYGSACGLAILVLVYVPIRSRRLFKRGAIISMDESMGLSRTLRLLRSFSVILGVLVCMRCLELLSIIPILIVGEKSASHQEFFIGIACESVLWGTLLLTLCLFLDLILGYRMKKKLAS